MINPADLRALVIAPTLIYLQLHSTVAEKLLLGTALAESSVNGQTYLKQIQGPALGIYQIEPATHDDLWKNFLAFHHPLELRVRGLLVQAGLAEKEPQLIWNLAYATAIARLVYYRKKAVLPPDDLQAIAQYWKRHYNTRLGAGTVAGFINKAGFYLG
jgi:hypothetical protein